MAFRMKKSKFTSPHAPTWCPGCGNFSIWVALKKAFEKLNLEPHKVLIVYGIGCSGNMSNTINAYGWHSLHGRALPTAIGAKLANPKLTVIAAAGDGDGYGEGLSHFIHAIRGNVNVLYLVHNNSVYGLTTGQAAPTAHRGFKAKSTPDGLIEEPINPLALALSSGASFVARGFSGNTDQLIDLIVSGIKHPGFAFIDIFQPCVTFNKINTYAFYYNAIYSLQDDPAYAANDRERALAKAFERRLPVGLFFQDAKRPSYLDDLSYLRGKPLLSVPKKRTMHALFKEFI